MRITIFLLTFFLHGLSALSQNAVISQVEPKRQREGGNLYALVMGISTYRYLKPLSYADKDADLFSDFLKSKAGGTITAQNLFLLKNDSANAGNFWSIWSRISSQNLKRGDRFYIYFAGHGDAIKGLNEYYLLLSDCQPAGDANNYLSGFSAINMYSLKNRIGLLTAKGVEVILILDACRTNELPGGYASQAFNTNITQAKVGDITMMATGPGQVSIEDASLGSGHGLFTYNLIDALSGKADREEEGNNDKKISLEELYFWVRKKVKRMAEANLRTQVPVFCCDEKNNTIIGTVDSSFSEAWAKSNNLSANNQRFQYADNKSKRGVASEVDSNLVALYNQFNTARKASRLWGDSSANSIYDQMQASYPTAQLTKDARYTLAADFINFAQQKINLYLEGKDWLSLEIMRERSGTSAEVNFLNEEYESLKKTVSEKWTVAGLMTEKAEKLLDDPLIAKQFKAKKAFLFARGFVSEEKENKLTYQQALSYATEAYKADSTAAFAAEGLGLVYAYGKSWNYRFRSEGYRVRHDDYGIPGDKSPALYYFKKAASLAPFWINPYLDIATKVFGQGELDSATQYLRKALDLSPKSGSLHILMGDLLRFRKADSSILFYKSALPLSPIAAHSEIYYRISSVFLLSGRWTLRSTKDSILFYSKKALSLNPKNVNAYSNLAIIYAALKKSDSAVYYLRIITQLDPQTAYPFNSIAYNFMQLNQRDSAITYYKKAAEFEQERPYIYMLIGDAYNDPKSAGYRDSAILYYQKVINWPAKEDDNAKIQKSIAKEKLAFLLIARNPTDSTALQYFTELLGATLSSYRAYFNLACYYANNQNIDRAVEHLEKAIQKGLRNPKVILSDPYIALIRNTKEFKGLMTQYFP